jgi:hypothetical protein
MTRGATNITWLGGLAFLLLLLGSLAGIGCDARSAEASGENMPPAPADAQARIERGKYLVNGIGCSDFRITCRTPFRRSHLRTRRSYTYTRFRASPLTSSILHPGPAQAGPFYDDDPLT